MEEREVIQAGTYDRDIVLWDIHNMKELVSMSKLAL